MWKRSLTAGLLLLIGCAGSPSSIGLNMPVPRDQVWADVERKVAELGYTVARSDRVAGLLVAEKTDPRAAPDVKEELQITVRSEGPSMTKLEISAARVLPAAGDRPIRRVAASGRTSADATAIINVFMKTKR